MLHGLVAAAGAIDNSPPTFVVTPRRCGSGVGGYPTFAELGLTVCGGSTRGMGERVGRAPRSKRLWKAMILDFSLFSTDQLVNARFQFAEQERLEGERRAVWVRQLPGRKLRSRCSFYSMQRMSSRLLQHGRATFLRFL